MLYLYYIAAIYYVAAMIREWEITTNVNVEYYEHVILSVIFHYIILHYMEAI